jgi:ATP-dependent Lon protease
MDNLDNKIIDLFPGKVVNKKLGQKLKTGYNAPSFVIEYLVGMYCATDDPSQIEEGMETVKNILTKHYIRGDEVEHAKYLMRERGSYKVIDKAEVYLNEKEDIYFMKLSTLKFDRIQVLPEFLEKYPRLLTTGVWAIIELKYLKLEKFLDEEVDIYHPIENQDCGIWLSEKNKKIVRATQEEIVNGKKDKNKRDAFDDPYVVIDFKPIQVPKVDMEELFENRKQFNMDQWAELIMRSCGLEPEYFNFRQKFHFFSRLIAFAENNYNLIELGPRGTGKSFVYKEISPNATLISGGKTTVAQLFEWAGLLGSRNVLGLVNLWDVVGFDEISANVFKNKDSIQILKDYMESGSYSRGKNTRFADASMVFVGNIDRAVETILNNKHEHLFMSIANEMQDTAFLERIHNFIPGWEFPKMKPEFITKNYGLIVDYFSEFLRSMRKYNYTDRFEKYFKLDENANQRDSIAIKRTFSGLSKILFPEIEMTKDEIRTLLEYSIEARRRVKFQLRRMLPNEYPTHSLGYIDLETNEKIEIFTKEEKDYL